LATSLTPFAAILGIIGVVIAVGFLTFSFYAGGRGNVVVGARLASGSPLSGRYDDNWYHTQAATGLIGLIIGVATLGLVAAFGLKDRDEPFVSLAQNLGKLEGRVNAADHALTTTRDTTNSLQNRATIIENDLRA
jgi:hypothetical protein